MIRKMRCIGVLSAILAALFTVPGQARAAVTHLESERLRLDVSAEPYSFTLTVKASAAVLLSHNATSLLIAGVPHRVTGAQHLVLSPTRMEADLSLADSSLTAHVVFQFGANDALTITYQADNAGVEAISETFDDQGEHSYGVWESPFNGGLDNRGIRQPYLGEGLPRLPLSYANGRAPFYMTSLGYAVYADSTAAGNYWFAVDHTTGFSFAALRLSYTAWYGPGYDALLARYNKEVGSATMPPLWAFDSMWWTDDEHADLHHARNAQENVIDLATQLAANHIRAGALWIDRPYGSGVAGWGNMDFDGEFPDPAAMIHTLNTQGLQLMIWVANRAWNTLYTEGSAHGYLFPKVDLKAGPAVDLSDPAAYAWLRQKLNSYAQLGIKGYKLDRGEESEQPDSAQNLNSSRFTRLAAESLSATQGTDQFIVSRNLVDTARGYSALWNGDSYGTFDGLRASVTSGLRAGALNFPMWGSDTGGYVGLIPGTSALPDKDLFARWLEFSAYSPIMEVLVGGGRTPWYNYDAELVQIAREQTDLHHDLVPYVRSTLYQAMQNGQPVMRPLAFAYPDDAHLTNVSDEYLYGDSLLIAPIVTAQTIRRAVILPAGQWLDYHDKWQLYQGGSTLDMPAPLSAVPVFVRAGAIIPRGDVLRANATWMPDWTPTLRIEMFPADQTASQFSYYTGQSVQPITITPDHGGFHIAYGDLGLPGTLEIYLSAFDSVRRGGLTLTPGRDYTWDADAHRLSVPFTGAGTLDIGGAVSLFKLVGSAGERRLDLSAGTMGTMGPPPL